MKTKSHRMNSTGHCRTTGAMTTDQLNALLAERVMGWTVAPKRFLIGKGRWMPSWRFQPTNCLDDAFQLLEKANAEAYTMAGGAAQLFQVRIRVREGAIGYAQDKSKAKAITLAIAHAVGISVEEIH
jgi:hypothetical protein